MAPERAALRYTTWRAMEEFTREGRVGAIDVTITGCCDSEVCRRDVHDIATGKATKLQGPVQAAAKKVVKHLAAGLGTGGVDEELHKARKAGKRARYAAEPAHPVLGKQTKNSISRYHLCYRSSIRPIP